MFSSISSPEGANETSALDCMKARQLEGQIWLAAETLFFPDRWSTGTGALGTRLIFFALLLCAWQRERKRGSETVNWRMISASDSAPHNLVFIGRDPFGQHRWKRACSRSYFSTFSSPETAIFLASTRSLLVLNQNIAASAWGREWTQYFSQTFGKVALILCNVNFRRIAWQGASFISYNYGKVEIFE